MVITLDTNVLFAGLYSQSGASHQILRAVLDEKLTLALSTPLYFEYYAVLTRPENLAKLRLTRNDVEVLLDVIAVLAKKHRVYYLLRPNLLDESDNLVVECAFASRSIYVITSNVKHLAGGELRGFPFKVITPREFIKVWRKQNG